MPEASGERAERVDRATWMVAGTVMLGSLMSVVDMTVVNVALHDLAQDLGVSITEVHWVASGYLLALAIAIPLAGWAAKRFGAKRVWLSSVALFLAGSMLAGMSWSIDSLIAFRIVQGLGGGIIIPVGLGLLAQAAGPARLGRVMSVVGIAQLIGPVFGPVLGGLLVEHGGWRWIFFVNVPVGVLALMLATRALPTEQPDPCERLDVRGFALLSPGLAAVVIGLAEMADGDGFAGPRAVGPIIAGIALVATFVVHARRVPNPLIDVRALQTRAFAAAAGTTFCLAMSLFGAMFLLPLYYQSARGLSPAEAGLMVTPQGLGAAITMPLAGRLTDRIGPRRVVIAGLALMLIGTLPLAWAGASTPYPLLAGALVVRGMGLGASIMPAQTAVALLGRSTEAVHRRSASNAMQRVGGSLGVALMSVVLGHNLGDRGPVALAFGHTLAWPVALTLLAFVPAAFLPRGPPAAQPRHGIARGREAVPVDARSGAT